MERGIDRFAAGLSSVRPDNPDNYDSDDYDSGSDSVLDNEEVAYLADDESVLNHEEVTYLSNNDSIFGHEEIAYLFNDDSVIRNEEVINLSDNNSVLGDEEVTYLSDDDPVRRDELANLSWSDSERGGDDGTPYYWGFDHLSDNEEVTYLSYNGEAYPSEINLVYGENSGAAATRGVDQERPAIKSLETKIIEYDERDSGGEDGGCCVICLEELTAGTVVTVMPCNHCSFHDGCLSTWLERSLCCPLCRRKIPGSPPPEPLIS